MHEQHNSLESADLDQRKLRWQPMTLCLEQPNGHIALGINPNVIIVNGIIKTSKAPPITPTGEMLNFLK